MTGPQRISSHSTPRPATDLVVPKAAPRLNVKAFSADARIPAAEGERQYQISQAWDPQNPGAMTGTEANRAITATYAWLDGRMSDYLGDPPVANWTTFGKYASREAGSQIQRFEALKGLVSENSLKKVLNNALGLLHDYIGHRESLSRQSRLMEQVSDGPEDYVKNVRLMRTTLVNGNAAIMHNIGPAFHAFLAAEDKGQDGVAAVRAAGYGRAPKDPQGFLLKAFEHYQQANALTKRLKTEKLDATQRDALVAQRRETVFQANLLVGIQEQMYALQTPNTFGNPDVQELMAAFTPTMQLSDAVNHMPLLPNGGNWANFAERMGFKEVPDASQPGALTIPDVDGRVRHYVINPDAKAREGTIVTYFSNNMNEAMSRRLIESGPAKYPTMYDGTMGRIKSMVGWLMKKVGLGDETQKGGDLSRLIGAES